MMNGSFLSTQISLAAIAVFLLQKLKGASWFPLLSEESAVWVKRAASLVFAFGAHTGIGYVWNRGAVPGAHQLIINVPPLAVIAVGLGHWAQQFVFQEVGYQGWKAASYVKTVAELLAKVPIPSAPLAGAQPAVKPNPGA